MRDITEAALPLLVDGVNVLAIGVWNNTPSSEDLVLVPQLILNRQLRRAPYLQQGTSDRMLVRWRTGQSVGSRVLYGPDPGSLTGLVSSATPTTEHEVPLVGLTPSTRYYYAVGTPSEILAGGDTEHFFVTPPPTGMAVPTRIWVLGDSGQGNQLAGKVRDAYYDYTDDVAGGGANARHTDLMLMLGDNAYPQGREQQYQENLFDIYPRTLRQTVLWPTIGNHDSEDTVAGTWPYYEAFSLPTGGEAGGEISGTEKYYAFDHGNIHFIVLNSLEIITTPGFATAMLGWLEVDLQNATEDWIVAYWHHPPYSKGGHDSDDPSDSSGRLLWMRENVLPVLEDYGVDLVLSGHSHSYERSYLIDGHYDVSSTFVESMKVDPGDGDENGGDGAYVKPYRGTLPYPGPGDGAVYTVAGNASHTTPGKAVDLGGTEPNHPAMVATILTPGSVVLDINGNRLDATLLDESGAILDEYTIFKGGPTELPDAEFMATPRVSEAPSTVSFTDLTTNDPTQWSWDFEADGQTDESVPGPTHEYGTAGLYPVSLTASNSAGVDSELKTDYVCVTAGSPGVVTGLQFDPDPTLFFWSAAPTAMSYDALRGDLTALVAGNLGSLGLVCLENDDDDQQATDTQQPGPDQAWFYLVGAANCAGEQGNYDSPGTAVSRNATMPSVCRSCATGEDDDSDESCADVDNCPGISNPGQEDADSDGVGDLRRSATVAPRTRTRSSRAPAAVVWPTRTAITTGRWIVSTDVPRTRTRSNRSLCGCNVAETDSDRRLDPGLSRRVSDGPEQGRTGSLRLQRAGDGQRRRFGTRLSRRLSSRSGQGLARGLRLRGAGCGQ